MFFQHFNSFIYFLDIECDFMLYCVTLICTFGLLDRSLVFHLAIYLFSVSLFIEA